MPKTFDIKQLQTPDSLADAISTKFTTWENARDGWYRNAKETLENLYATSTADIYNQPRDFDNKTHIPKLTQIRDMLITYYLDAMFSLPDYVDWEPYNNETVSVTIQNSMKALIRQMLDDSNFKPTIRQIVEDYVDYGNAFATAINASETVGSKIIYEGPKAVRLNPLDVFFDPTAVDFKHTPIIVRSITTLGELMKSAEQFPDDSNMYTEALRKAVEKRHQIRNTLNANTTTELQSDMCTIAGVGTWSSYYNSDTVEILTFYGDIYDIDANKLYKGKRIIIMDRSVVLLNEDIRDFGFCHNIFKAGWRDRKDNLWSMSPLDNIKGMQFMIDFLENKRADIFNFISNPVFFAQGDIESPEYMFPGAIINGDVGTALTPLRPDATALQADTYIDRYLMQMEEMAGTPREAMGFRTPGEKTAFEVSQLNTASSRLFNEKTHKFELEILEPLLTLMVRMFLSMPGRTVRVSYKDANGVDIERELSVDELQMTGRFVATGSSTYTEKAKIAQTFMQLANSAIYNDPLVSNFFNPKVIAQAIVYATGLDKFKDILVPNARVDAELELREAQEFNQRQLEETQVRGMMDAQQANV